MRLFIAAAAAISALEAESAEGIRISRVVMGIAIDLISARRDSARCRRILVPCAGEVGRIVGRAVVDGGSRPVAVVVVVVGRRREVEIPVVEEVVVGREVAAVGMRIDRYRVRRRKPGISIGCDGVGSYRYEQVR